MCRQVDFRHHFTGEVEAEAEKALLSLSISFGARALPSLINELYDELEGGVLQTVDLVVDLILRGPFVLVVEEKLAKVMRMRREKRSMGEQLPAFDC